MKKILIFLIVLFGLIGCSTTQYIPVETIKYKTEIVKDTIIDSVRVETIKEVYFDRVQQFDTLYLKSTLAESWSWVEGNKLEGKIKSEHKCENKYIYKTEFVDRVDSLKVEVPVEVIKYKYKYPPIFWVCLGISVFFIGGIVIKIINKFKLIG